MDIFFIGLKLNTIIFLPVGLYVCPDIFGFLSFQIESALPTLAKPIMSLDATEDAIVGTLKQSLVISNFHRKFCVHVLNLL